MADKVEKATSSMEHIYCLYRGEDDNNYVPERVTHLEVDSSVKTIPKCAFSELSHLEEVVFPEGLLEIGEFAFLKCCKLECAHLPSTVKRIHRGAFAGCVSLKSPFHLPSSGLETIGEGCFEMCTSLRNFRIPSSVTGLQCGLFAGCKNLISIELPEEIKVIRPRAISDCEDLVNVAISSSKTEIEAGEFNGSAVRRLFWEEKGSFKISSKDFKALPETILAALKTRFDGLPIHKICYYQAYKSTEAVIEDLEKALQFQTDGNRQDFFGMTPLHILCLSTKQNLALLEILVQRFPKDLITHDKQGRLPIHYACHTNAPLELIEHLLEAHRQFPDPCACWLMISVVNAIMGDSSVEIIQTLLEAHKSHFPNQKMDFKWHFPNQKMDFKWHLKFCSKFKTLDLHLISLLFEHQLASDPEQLLKFYMMHEDVQVVKFLVQTSISNRLKHLGLKRWRLDVMKMVDEIPEEPSYPPRTCGGGHRSHRESHIDWINLKLAEYEFKEAISLVELMLWDRMIIEEEAIHLQESKRTQVLLPSHRMACRVNCGSDIVISNVMSFLKKTPRARRRATDRAQRAQRISDRSLS